MVSEETGESHVPAMQEKELEVICCEMFLACSGVFRSFCLCGWEGTEEQTSTEAVRDWMNHERKYNES